MSVGEILFTHAVAKREGKLPFFFSRFNFDRMKERGNTHYCCVCLARAGFKIDNDGKPVNVSPDDGDAVQKHHDATHAPYTIGNADKYDNPWDWLKGEIKPDFPCVITIPSLL